MFPGGINMKGGGKKGKMYKKKEERGRLRW
jgi:hypothetical protein